jgi:hypothetical protein
MSTQISRFSIGTPVICASQEALVESDSQFLRKAIWQFDPVTILIFHIDCYTFCIAMRFEWDPEKNRINKQKHDGLGFESVALVFDDPHTIFRKDRVVWGETEVARHRDGHGRAAAGCPRRSLGE